MRQTALLATSHLHKNLVWVYPPPQRSGGKSDDFIFSQTPLLLKSYTLYKAVAPLIHRFPKPWRYSIGEKLQTSILSIIDLTCQALYARQPLKEPYILKVIGAIQTAQLFVRLALEEKLIEEHQYFRLSASIIELHRMACGWLKSTRSS